LNYKIDADTIESLKKAQKNEITEYHIYSKLSSFIKNEHNSKVLKQIAQDELSHHNELKKFTGTDMKPNIFWKYTFIPSFHWYLGITFGIKLMEKGGKRRWKLYRELGNKIEEFKTIAKEENKHEEELIEIIEEEKLQFVGSMVLGLNDALVELTGTLAGLTFALKNTRLIALSGLITGIAATLQWRHPNIFQPEQSRRAAVPLNHHYIPEEHMFSPLHAGISLPFIFQLCAKSGAYNYYGNINNTCFQFLYISSQGSSFKQRFFEMAGISLGVAVISFIIGHFVRLFLGVDV